LELAALTLGVIPGDEVILPSFTFVSTANAFALRGATLRFADIEPDTLCIDPAHIEALATERTRVIVPVHYAGIACRMDAITPIAQQAGAAIVEDNAHGLFGSVNGRALGTFGAMSTLSFHETKNVSCGEGGALVVYDPELLERAEIFREKGTNRSQFFRGAIDKYTWVDLGSSWLPSEYATAVLVAGLLAAQRTQVSRHRIWTTYHEGLATWARDNGVRQPIIPGGVEHPAHLYYLLLPGLAERTRFIDHMKQAGVNVVFHYVPLHSSPMGRRLTGEGALPVTERVSDQLVRLPLFPDLTGPDVEQVVAAVTSFRP
jgi:dTDP-4-amino-4,6-dideoxygalactose transaminase